MKEPVNTWTHFVTFIAGVIGALALILLSRGQASKMITMIIYGISLMVLYGASTIYHWADTTEKRERVLRKIDHISIFLLIAGTYTPVFYYGLAGAWRSVMLTVVWGLALVGIILKIFFTGTHRMVSTIFYVALGWIALVPLYKLLESFPKGAMALMFLGGGAYTLGGIIYATKLMDFIPGKFGFHEVFHLFTSLGSVLHYIMILRYIALP